MKPGLYKAGIVMCIYLCGFGMCDSWTLCDIKAVLVYVYLNALKTKTIQEQAPHLMSAQGSAP